MPQKIKNLITKAYNKLVVFYYFYIIVSKDVFRTYMHSVLIFG